MAESEETDGNDSPAGGPGADGIEGGDADEVLRGLVDNDEKGAAPAFDLTSSRQFAEWLAERRTSLAFTTYQAGKVFFIGLQANGRLSIFERTLNRCMGMVAAGDSLYISTLYQLWRFENALQPGQAAEGYDRLYVPQVGYVTGDLDIHDLAVDGSSAANLVINRGRQRGLKEWLSLVVARQEKSVLTKTGRPSPSTAKSWMSRSPVTWPTRGA